MSISQLVVRNSFSLLKEKLGFELRMHGHEIVVGTIMTAISIAIATISAGDISEAFARPARNR